MFVLTKEELADWRSQFVTSKSDRMGLRHPPMVFTEQGVAMLSSVLRSERAIQVNIAIMRVLVKLRQMLAAEPSLARRLDRMEEKYDRQCRVVFEAIRELSTAPRKSPKRIGFGARGRASAHDRADQG